MSSKINEVRYAVVGLGHIAQAAVLPAFENAGKSSRLSALVSGDRKKLGKLGNEYGVSGQFTYDEYDALLASGDVDAVYIALPNSLHADYAVRAAKAGVHILCEKPLAPTSAECRRMVRAAETHDVRLMTAYRLHFEKANLEAVEAISSGKIGEPRIFTSVFTMNVREPNDIRLRRKFGGGPLADIGIYCLNAARYLFRSEPLAVSALAASSDDPRFVEVPEMVAVTLQFPGSRLASFTASFGAASTGTYRVIGTRGDLYLDPAYGYGLELKRRLTINGRARETTYPRRDQFAAELTHFSGHLLARTLPGPSGREGLIDVLVMEAIEKSILANGRSIRLSLPVPESRPDLSQEIRRPTRAPGPSPPRRRSRR